MVAASAFQEIQAMSIGERIKELRGKESRDDFAASLGVTRNTVQRYEIYGRTPSADFVADLCNKYKVNADWLIFGTMPKYRNEERVAPLDEGILIDAVLALEEALEAKGRVMAPAAKAEIIAQLYAMLAEEDQEETQHGTRSNLARILKLVA